MGRGRRGKEGRMKGEKQRQRRNEIIKKGKIIKRRDGKKLQRKGGGRESEREKKKLQEGVRERVKEGER